MWKGEKPTDKPAFSNAVAAYATYRLGFPPSMYDRLAAEGILKAGMNHLDLGTGTGTLAVAAAARGLNVTALDIDDSMLEQAQRFSQEANLPIHFENKPAEQTGKPSECFDIVTAGQCWHWFDRTAAAKEAYRVLRLSGHLAICHYDWLPVNGNEVAATEKLILQHNPKWTANGGNGIHPWWFRDLAEAGFTNIQSFTYDEPAIYTHDAWVNRIEASAGIAILGKKQRAKFKEELSALLRQDFPDEPLHTAHRVFCVWGQKRMS